MLAPLLIKQESSYMLSIITLIIVIFKRERFTTMKNDNEDYCYSSGSSADFYDSYDFNLQTQCGKGSSTTKRGVGKAGGSSQTRAAYSQKHIRLRETRKSGRQK